MTAVKGEVRGGSADHPGVATVRISNRHTRQARQDRHNKTRAQQDKQQTRHAHDKHNKTSTMCVLLHTKCLRGLIVEDTAFVATGVAAGQPVGRQPRPPTVLVTRTGLRTEKSPAYSRQPIATVIPMCDPCSAVTRFQMPPIACAVDSAHDVRRLVRREERVVRREPPSAG